MYISTYTGERQTLIADIEMKVISIIIAIIFFCINIIETQAGEKPFVSATLMVAVPDESHIQSAYGHAFLRMECPSEQLDYCFSLETSGWEKPLNILTGNYAVRVRAVETSTYLNQFNNSSSKREVRSYPLNLTTQEIQHLWKDLDDTMMLGILPYHDFVTNGCSQQLMNIIIRNINGRMVFDTKAIEDYGTTVLAMALCNPHTSSYLNLLLPYIGNCKADFEKLAPQDRLFIPSCLAQILEHATIVDNHGVSRSFLKESTHCEPIKISSHYPWLYWFAMAAMAVLTITYITMQCESKISRKVTLPANIMIVTAYTLLFMFLLFITSTSKVSVIKGWNWNYIWLNQLWIVVIYYITKHFINKLKTKSV